MRMDNKPKLTEADKKGVMVGYKMGIKKAELARIYGVSWVAIHKLVKKHEE